MEQKLREIVAKIAEAEPGFDINAHLRDDLNVDSFHAVEIIFEIERAFEVKVPDNKFGQVQTFSDLLQLVQSLKAG